MKFVSTLVALFTLTIVFVTVSSSTEEYGLTPSGYFPVSCIHAIPEGHVVNDLGHFSYIQDKNGKFVRIVPPCKQQRPKKSSPRDAVNPFPNGWSAYAHAFRAGTFTSYNGTWTVPVTPKDQAAETLFLFTGFQNNFGTLADVTNIIQPVLQWGRSSAGGGKYWSMASWYVDSADNAYWSPLKQTASGHTIQGNMILSGTTWAITIIDMDTNTPSTLSIATNTTEPYAFVTLEVYSITSCMDYPTGEDTFYDLVFSPAFTPQWTPAFTPGCSEGVKVNNVSSVSLIF